jgi:hypothetical protein
VCEADGHHIPAQLKQKFSPLFKMLFIHLVSSRSQQPSYLVDEEARQSS